MIIYLKSGQIIKTNDRFTRKSESPVSGDLVGLYWETNGNDHLEYIDLDLVAAIVNDNLETPAKEEHDGGISP